jgi:hypothetical protein
MYPSFFSLRFGKWVRSSGAEGTRGELLTYYLLDVDIDVVGLRYVGYIVYFFLKVGGGKGDRHQAMDHGMKCCMLVGGRMKRRAIDHMILVGGLSKNTKLIMSVF